MIQDPKNIEIRYSQRLALVTARRTKNDSELEQRIANALRDEVLQANFVDINDSSPAGKFRNQYFSYVGSEQDCAELEKELRELAKGSQSEWSYSLACGDESMLPIEIAPQLLEELPELEGTAVEGGSRWPEYDVRDEQELTVGRRGTGVSELSGESVTSPIREGEKVVYEYWR